MIGWEVEKQIYQVGLFSDTRKLTDQSDKAYLNLNFLVLGS